MDAILSVEVGGAGENLFLVFEDGFDHLGDGGRRSVIRGSSREMLYDLGATVAGALDDAIESGFIHEFGDRNAGDGGIARERAHGVAMSAGDEGGKILHADFEFLRDKSAEAGGVEHAGHADDALARKAAHLVGGLRHGV